GLAGAAGVDLAREPHGVLVVLLLPGVDRVVLRAVLAVGGHALDVAGGHDRAAEGDVPLVGRPLGGREVLLVAALGVVPRDRLHRAGAVGERALLVEVIALRAAEAGELGHLLALVGGAVPVLVAVG